MSLQGGWVFSWIFLPIFLVIPGLAVLGMLAASYASYISGSDAFAVLAGFVVGEIPGLLVIAYAYSKATTRYVRDTPREAAEKVAKEAADKTEITRTATLRALAAKLAFSMAAEAKEAADQAAAEAAENAAAATDAKIRARLDKEAAAKKEQAKDAAAKLDAASNLSASADAAEEAARNAATDAAERAAAAEAEAAKAEASRGAGAKTAAAGASAVAKALAAARAKEADDNARAASEAAAKAEAARSEANAKAAAARGTAGEQQAADEARAKAAAAQSAAAAAETAKEIATQAAKDEVDAVGDWRSTLLNPKGLQQTTLERAGKIREDEFKAFNFLAMFLVAVCWAAFAVCWGGRLDFSPAINNADIALQLSSAGAYVYVLILLGRRNFQRDITQGTVLWCCVTLAVGPLLALVLAYVWTSSSGLDFGPLNEKAIFFFAGLAPRHVTALLLDILGRIILAVQGKPASISRMVPLQQVRGITPEIEERLQEEGIFDAINLAMADPLRLLRNTSFDKFQILTWIDEALLIYTFPQHWQALESEGITGAMDLAWYVVYLPDTEVLANQIKYNPESLKKVVQRLAEDAQVQLIWILYDLDNPNGNRG